MKKTAHIAVITVVVLLVAGMMSSAIAAAKSGVSAEAKQHYEKARQLQAQQETAKATEELKTAIQLSPEFVEAQQVYIASQRGQKDIEKPYETYVKDNPNSAVYHYLLGKAYQATRGKEAEAKAENKKALELDPKFAWALVAEASFAARSGDRAKAFENALKAKKLAGNNVELHAELAKLFYGFHDYVAVAQEVKIVQKSDPTDFSIYDPKWRAIMAADNGSDKAKAEVAADAKRLETDPSKNVVALRTAMAGYRLVDNKEAADRVKAAIDVIAPPKPRPAQMGQMMGRGGLFLTGPANEKFQQAIRLKDPVEKVKALRELQRQVTEAKERAEVLLPAIIKAQISAGDILGAARGIGQFGRTGAEPLTEANASLDVVRALVEMKQFGSALGLVNPVVDKLKKYLDSKPEGYAGYYAPQALASALELQGQALLEQGQPEKAIAVLNECEKVYESKDLDPSANVSLNIARAYLKMGKQNEAIAAFAKAYSIPAHDVNAAKNHAAVAKEGGQSALRGVPEKEKTMASIKAELQPVYGKRAEQKPLDAFLSDQLKVYNKKLVLDAMEKTKMDKPATDFTLTLVKGGKIKLSELRGKVVLLNFWATW